MNTYSVNVQVPEDSDGRDATYYSELQQQLGCSVWVEQVRLLHREHCAEVEIALAPLRTNIVIKIDTRKSGTSVSQIVSKACEKLRATVRCDLWPAVGQIRGA